MSEANFLDYAVTALVIAAAAFLLLRFIKQTLAKSPGKGDAKGGAKGCSGCAQVKDCAALEESRPPKRPPFKLF